MNNSTETICVFCGSSEDLDSIYYQTATELGSLLGQNNYNLIHGAGIIGLMGHLMLAASISGSKVTGVVPERLNRENIVDNKLQELIVTKDMKDRKEYMREKSDAFIALPGGFGTIEELLEVITLKQLKYHQKPIVIINTKDFYSGLLSQFKSFYNNNFANKSYESLYFVADNPLEAIDYIKTYKYNNIYDKYLKE